MDGRTDDGEEKRRRKKLFNIIFTLPNRMLRERLKERTCTLLQHVKFIPQLSYLCVYVCVSELEFGIDR